MSNPPPIDGEEEVASETAGESTGESAAPTSIAEIKAAIDALAKGDNAAAWRLVRAAINGKADDVDMGQIVKALARRLGVKQKLVDDKRREIERGMKASNAPTDKQREAQAEAERLALIAEAEALYERVKPIATSPTLIDDMTALVGRMGVVNEKNAIKATYLASASRLHIMGAISLLRRGAAAGGKNHLVEKVLRLIPEESVIQVSNASPKALIYEGGMDAVDALKNKIVYVAEASAIADKGDGENEFTGMLRTLISENHIYHRTVQTQDSGPPLTIVVIKNGPIAVIMTSARDNVEVEMFTRLLLSDADESGDQTRSIVANVLTNRTDGVADEKIAAWVDFQRWLEAGAPYDVFVPFLEAIRSALGKLPEATLLRFRRDITGFVRAIMASAILHIEQRQRDELGRIVAELSDYEIAHAAFDHDLGSLYARNVSPALKALVRVVEGMIEEEQKSKPDADDAKVTYDDLTAALGISSNNTASRRLKDALRQKLIELVEPPGGLGKTTARRYRVLVPSVDIGKTDIGVFPKPDVVRAIYTRYTRCTRCSEGVGGGCACVSDDNETSDAAHKGGRWVSGIAGVAGATGIIPPAAKPFGKVAL